MAVEISPAAPYPITAADAAGGEASATGWAAFITLDLSDSAPSVSFYIAGEEGRTHLQVLQPDFTLRFKPLVRV
jgi:hypothetical protein